MAAALTTATIEPAYAAGCSSSVPGDVNGDGRAEVAVSERGSDGGSNAVHVFYGRTAGLATSASGRALDDQYFDLSTPGVPGDPTASNGFGNFTTFGDFNGDGCADLAVSVPDEEGPEAVVVLYGSPSGITTRGAQRLSAATLPLGPVDLFGPLVVGDLDDDGIDDLAIGSSGTTVSGHPYAGGVVVLFGDDAGLDSGSTTAELLTRDTAGVPGSAQTETYFGYRLAVGDFDGDGIAELAISTDTPETVQTVERGPLGYGAAQPAPIDEKTLAVRGGSITDAFGWSLAAGDVDHDGRDDLAIGIRDWSCLDLCPKDASGAGAIALVRGSAAGLSTANHQFWSFRSPGITDSEHDLGFGATLAMGRLDADAYVDLAAGTTYDGTVTILHGGPGGFTIGSGRTATTFTPKSVGLPKSMFFGRALAVSHVQSRTQASLVIGAEETKVGKYRNAGEVIQLSIKKTGPTARHRTMLNLQTRGVKGNAHGGDYFGYEVS
jgi:hypothetical protein